jgi:hypothetical protein
MFDEGSGVADGRHPLFAGVAGHPARDPSSGAQSGRYPQLYVTKRTALIVTARHSPCTIKKTTLAKKSGNVWPRICILEVSEESGSPGERGQNLEERLKSLMQDLGNAINESLSDSERIAEAIGEIKGAGYDVFLVLEATIGFNKRDEREDPKRSHGR